MQLLTIFFRIFSNELELLKLRLCDRTEALENFKHLRRCVYLLGVEDHGLSKIAMEKAHFLYPSLNVVVAGSIVLSYRSRGKKRV